MSTSYSTFRIRKDSDVSLAVPFYRDLRLNALKTSPESFISTYESESALTEAQWAAQLLEARTETFVCAAQLPQEKRPLSQQWVGQATLRGPLTDEEYNVASASCSLSASSAVVRNAEKWHLLGVFVSAEHRGHGLAQRLCQEALRYLAKERQVGDRDVVLRLMVKKVNSVAIRLYEKLGFEVTGDCTLIEALTANEMATLIPQNAGALEKYTAPSGIVMTKVVQHGKFHEEKAEYDT